MASLTSEQAAFMLHTLGLPALKAEHSLTSAVIAAIPPEGAAYRPHSDSRSAFDLAWHIVSAEMSTYLRPMGAKVPSLYGPSYDAGGFTGGTPSRSNG